MTWTDRQGRDSKGGRKRTSGHTSGDHIRPKLKRLGLEWVDFQVMRATHASIGHRLKLDRKVTADQRGHGVGVAIEEYTKTSVKDKAVAAKKLEEAVLGKEKIVRMPPRKAS